MKKIFSIAALLIIITVSAFSQWTEQTSGVTTQLYCVSAIDNNNVWIGGESGKVLRTTNGGSNWDTVTNPSSYHNLRIFGIDANTALVGYYNTVSSLNILMRTTNGGANWTQVFSQQSPNYGSSNINGIWMSSATNGLFLAAPVGGRWSLWKTTNGGVNWDSTGMYLAAQGNAYCSGSLFASGTNYYFGSNSDTIYYSSNSGLNWARQIAPYEDVTHIWFNNATTGICGMGKFSLGKTTNSGSNWLSINDTISSGVSGIVGSGTNYWLTTGHFIYRSTNNGTSWTTDYTHPSNINLYSVSKARTGNRMWAISLSGTISVSDGLNAVTPVSNEVPSSFKLAQNYPNPFNPSTTIKFSIPSASAVNIKIYDMLGNEVMTVVNESLQAGTYSTNVNMSDLSSGIYFYNLKAGNYIETKKMTLVK